MNMVYLKKNIYMSLVTPVKASKNKAQKDTLDLD